MLFDGEYQGSEMEVFTDASFADDSTDRKSSQGYMITLYGTPIAWRALKQPTVTTSFTKVELFALTKASKEVIVTMCVKTGLKNTYFIVAVQRCCGDLALFLGGAVLFYNAVALKSAAVARAFSAAYVCGPIRWNVRFSATNGFSAMCSRIGGTCTFRSFMCKNFELPTYSQFLIQHGYARFQFSELGEICTFESSIPETSGRCNNSAFLSLIAG